MITEIGIVAGEIWHRLDGKRRHSDARDACVSPTELLRPGAHSQCQGRASGGK